MQAVKDAGDVAAPAVDISKNTTEAARAACANMVADSNLPAFAFVGSGNRYHGLQSSI